jgi:alanyl-tRNA synthetase
VLKAACEAAKTKPESLVEKIVSLSSANRQLEKELEQLKVKLAGAAGSDVSSEAIDIRGVKLLAKTVDGLNAKTLRDTADQLKNKLGSSIVVLATVEDDKISIVVGVSKDLVSKVKAGELVNMVAMQIGGKGGGRPDMAMAGGSDVGALPQALASIEAWVADRV